MACVTILSAENLAKMMSTKNNSFRATISVLMSLGYVSYSHDNTGDMVMAANFAELADLPYGSLVDPRGKTLIEKVNSELL